MNFEGGELRMYMGVCEMGIMSEKERVFVRVMKRKSEKEFV